MSRAVEHLGPLLCLSGGACMVAGLAVELDSTAAKVLMAVAAILFVPGAVLTYAWLRARVGPPA